MTIGTLVLSDVLAIVLPALFIVWLLRHRREYVPRSDLTRRGNVIVKGVVEADSPPVTIDYEQRRWHVHNAEHNDGEAVYDWEEQDRTIEGKPFVLRTAEARIPVDPDEDDVALLWDPDHPRKWRDLDFIRINRAVLEPGASVEIFGAFTPAPAPTLVPSRVERLLISKRPIAPKFTAMRHYLAMRACATVALVAVCHLAFEPVWRSDLAQVGIGAPSETVRAWIGIVLAAIALYCLRAKRPWRAGRCNQREVVTSATR